VAPPLTASRQRPTPIRSSGFPCLLQKHPVPLPFGASSTETVGKLFLFLHIYFSCCPELLPPVSSDGSFAKCLPRPGWGVCNGVSSSCERRAGARAARLPTRGLRDGPGLSPRSLRGRFVVAFAGALARGCMAALCGCVASWQMWLLVARWKAAHG